MKVGAIGERPVEWAALAAKLIPTPIFDTMVATLLARTVLTATKLGVFDVLADKPLPARAVAEQINCHPAATAKLLTALAGAGYLRVQGDCFALAPLARTWLLATSDRSLRDALLFQLIEQRFVEHMEDYIRTGTPVDIHASMAADDWSIYQRAMRSGANLAAPEIAWRTPVPRGARAMLDIGGAHGYYSVAICRRHPNLRATILDLPAAVEHAAPLLAREGMGDRVTHRAENALTADLGEAQYDLVLIANLVHHFDDATNRALLQRVARALRPGGIVVVGEMIRSTSARLANQVGALTDLYFAITSDAGTYSFAEIADWQRAAGLRPRRPLRLVTGPGAGLQAASKPRAV